MKLTRFIAAIESNNKTEIFEKWEINLLSFEHSIKIRYSPHDFAIVDLEKKESIDFDIFKEQTPFQLLINSLLEFNKSDNSDYTIYQKNIDFINRFLFEYCANKNLHKPFIKREYKKYSKKFEGETIEQTALWFIYALTNPQNEQDETSKILTMLKAFIEDNLFILKKS